MKVLIACLVLAAPLAAQRVAGAPVPAFGSWANRPGSAATGTVYTVTDDASAGACTGGGSAVTQCRWNGNAWAALGVGGGSDTPIFTGGTQVQHLVQCAHGAINYNDAGLTATSSAEIGILTGISGNVRWDQVLVSPVTAFTGGAATLPTVSMGRPGTNNSEMTGALVPVGSGSAPWTARPIPPQLTGTYGLVLNFSVATGVLNTFTAGALYWEACGYAAQ
jgi:hypothetical protein